MKMPSKRRKLAIRRTILIAKSLFLGTFHHFRKVFSNFFIRIWSLVGGTLSSVWFWFFILLGKIGCFSCLLAILSCLCVLELIFGSFWLILGILGVICHLRRILGCFLFLNLIFGWIFVFIFHKTFRLKEKE